MKENYLSTLFDYCSFKKINKGMDVITMAQENKRRRYDKTIEVF